MERPITQPRILTAALLCSLAACSADAVIYEGRPCSTTEPCGGLTSCDLRLGICVRQLSGDAAGEGLTFGDAAVKDATLAEDALVDKAVNPTDGKLDGPTADGPVQDLPITPDGCVTVCAGKICGAADGCGGSCAAGSGCCTPSCSGKICGAADGCGGSCAAGSGCCTPSCSGKICGAADGCGGSCAAGSGCTTCPKNCHDVNMLKGGEIGPCTFSSSTCKCGGTDSNSNNICDSGEACWGWNHCKLGTSKLCATKHNPAVPAGCPAIGSCFKC